MLCILASGTTDILELDAFDSEGISWPLNFTAAAKSSVLYGSMPQSMYNNLATEPLTDNLHHDGVTPQAFAASKPLTAAFTMLSTNVDRKGKPFVSSMEAKALPIFATQYHPERPGWEYTASVNASHTAAAVSAMSDMAATFVKFARAVPRSFASPEAEAAALIWGAATVVPTGTSYETYYF